MTDRGFVLLNALILTMAMAGVAAGLLALAATGTARLGTLRDGDQAGLYLSAGEMLLEQVLERDWEDSPDSDHLGELWATQGYTVPIDRGSLGGQITDLQGLFNVNWLTDPDDSFTPAAFQRMFQDLGLPVAVASAIRDHVRDGGPPNPVAYSNRPLPIAATGDAIRHPLDLRAVPGMDDATLARLMPYVTALPPDSRLNVNTAPVPVLAALIPAAGRRGAEAFVRDRDGNAFTSRGDFAARAARLLPDTALEGFGASRFAVSSEWFSATLSARVDDHVRERLIYLHRSAQSGSVTQKLRLDLP